MGRNKVYAEIEHLLRNYKNFKVAIKNLQQQLDFIMPGITARYELREGTIGTFSVYSSTEKYAIDRIESRRALMIHEQMKHYEMIVSCIDAAMDALDEEEKEFIRLRYFENRSTEDVAQRLNFSRRNIFYKRMDILEKLKISLSGLLEI